MTEDEKRKFHAWKGLQDHASREFEDKVRAEWRLSFGIRAALPSAAGVVIARRAISVSTLVCLEMVFGRLLPRFK